VGEVARLLARPLNPYSSVLAVLKVWVESARIERERTVIQHQIEAIDRQIDRLVYELYGLTDIEISLVEEALG
jgi:hypothetical protein